VRQLWRFEGDLVAPNGYNSPTTNEVLQAERLPQTRTPDIDLFREERRISQDGHPALHKTAKMAVLHSDCNSKATPSDMPDEGGLKFNTSTIVHLILVGIIVPVGGELNYLNSCMNRGQIFSLIQLCAFIIPLRGEDSPPKIVRNVFHSTFDSKELGRAAPGAIVDTRFDSDKIGSFPEEIVFISNFERTSIPNPPTVVTTSFEDGISPEIFQWNQESHFRQIAGGRNGTQAVIVESANAMLETHKLPAEPKARYEVSVWYKGEGKVKIRAFDGILWLESTSSGAKQQDWSLAVIGFVAQPPPAAKKDAKIVAIPRPRLAAALGLQGKGKIVFDDFKIVRLGESSLSSADMKSGEVWDAHQTELGKGPDGGKAVRIRNGHTLDSKMIPVEPGKEYVQLVLQGTEI
jgi:hypothetical protein